MSKELENAWAVQEIWQDKCYKLEQENKNLKLTLEQMENTCKDYLNDRDTLREENKKLNEIICLYKSDEEEYKNKIEELEDDIRRLYNEASYLGFKF